MATIRQVQQRLLDMHFNPGVVDGLWGRNTLAALTAFQKSRGLNTSGKLDEATISALQLPPTLSLPEEFPWMQIILRKKGLHEGRDNAALREFLKSDGKTLGDPAKLPWCGDLIETAIALALPKEALPVNPYLARNWLKFGRSAEPGYGAVLVFGRGKDGISGHVTTYYAEDKTHYHVAGGNQSNSISITRIAKNRLLGARMPLTGGPYRRMTVLVAATGAVSVNEA